MDGSEIFHAENTLGLFGIQVLKVDIQIVVCQNHKETVSSGCQKYCTLGQW